MPEHSLDELLDALEHRRAIPPPPKKITKYAKSTRTGWYGVEIGKVRHWKKPDEYLRGQAYTRWRAYKRREGWYGPAMRDDILLDMVAAGMRYEQIVAYTRVSTKTIARAIKQGRQTLDREL